MAEDVRVEIGEAMKPQTLRISVDKEGNVSPAGEAERFFASLARLYKEFRSSED